MIIRFTNIFSRPQRWHLLALSIACSFLALPSLSSAQQKNPYDIKLKATTLHPEPNAKQWLKQSALARTNDRPRQVLLQFETIPTEEQKAQLKSKGITIVDYVNGNAFTAILNPGLKEEAVNGYAVRSITEIKSEWKGREAFWKKVATLGARETEIQVSFLKQLDPAVIKQFTTAFGATLHSSEMENLGLYTVTIPANKISAFAQWYGVRYVSPARVRITLDAEANAAANVTKLSAPVSLGGFGLKGDGIAIGVGDNVSGIYHIDNVDRIINYNPMPMTTHGVHINGIIGSAGILDHKAEGVAPHATLIDHLYDIVLANTGAMRQAHNMNITNNSYATVILDTGYAGTYDDASVALDELANEYPDVLHIFAAGNDGFQIRPPYPAGNGTVTGGYQPAKNNIVVTNNTKHLISKYDASRGPVEDGRLKPEVACIGDPILSTKGIDIYLVATGTSMACPQASGVAGLLTERYKQLHSNVNPRADLLKAIILNGTYDIGNPGPDYTFGFGFMNANRSRQIIDSNWYTTNTMATTGGQQSFTINVPANTSKLKVMLCYHDQPGSALSGGIQLVNDLDIEVTEPSSTVHKPLVLNTDVPNVTDFAVEARDSLNNTEQVTINSPAAGTYTVTVKGHSLPVGNQQYVVTYDFVPVGIQFKNPLNGTSVATNDSLCIYWDASDDPNTQTLEFSTNNGGSWTTLDNNIPSDQRHYIWYVPNVSSEQCLLRLTRNTTSMTTTSGTFVIAPQPQVYLDSSALCPGYIKVNWAPVPNATGYIVMRKHGFFMQTDATVTDTTYTYSGLSLDSFYYIAVQPIINGTPGYRSKAVTRKPIDGPCNGNISDGDLMVERILQPTSGRQLTSTQLTNNETMVVRVRNMDNVVSGAYTLHYAVNGTWFTQPGTGIPALGFTDVSVQGINLSAAGSYTLEAAIQNNSATDVVSRNDSARKVVRNLINNVVSLTTPVNEGFENFAQMIVKRDTMGLSPDQRWDYANNLPDSGRLRTRITDSFLITGNRSITMDLSISNGNGAQNYFIGTYNFTGLDVASDEVRVDFDYMLQAKPKFYNGNEFWVRGSDTNAWIPVFHYDTAVAPGVVVSSGTLSVTQALASHGQNFSSSFQVRFGQMDTTMVAARSYGNGATVDNFRIYTLQKDMQLLSLLTPDKTNCGLTGSQPVSIRLYNSVSQVQNNVQVYYKFDNGPVVNESIASIAGYDTIDYVFNQQIAVIAPGTHTLSVWLSAPGDSLLINDSIMNTTLHNQPLISTFPFLENFEASNGSWYHEGVNDSWEWGTPSSGDINSAASGTKAWKTNLDGYYNDLEQSYLYTTCFDISALDSPILSYKLITEIEHCAGTPCDQAYMEYSYNGTAWTRLGAYGQGTNWYNDSAANIWNRDDSVFWHDATIPLPASTQPIRFRYVFKSDPGTNKEGMGIDDFRIYEYVDTTVIPEEPFEGLVVYPNPNTDGLLKIKWSGAVGDKIQIAITDVAGRVVFREDHIANGTANETKLITGKMMTGVYVVKIIINDRKYYKKVLFH